MNGIINLAFIYVWREFISPSKFVCMCGHPSSSRKPCYYCQHSIWTPSVLRLTEWDYSKNTYYSGQIVHAGSKGMLGKQYGQQEPIPKSGLMRNTTNKLI